MKLFGLDKYNIVQLHVVLVLFGYWFVSGVANIILGETSQSISIGYRVFQFAVSLYVVFLCRKDIVNIQPNSLPIVCVFALIFFSIRVLLDSIGGVFVSVVPKSWFMKDILYTVVGIFFSAFALFASRKYIDIDRIVTLAFWVGLATIICVLLNLNNLDINIEEERADAGRGLGTLALVKIGAIETLLSLHLIFGNSSKKKLFIYLIGLCLGIVTCLVSGSRGGLVAMILALGMYALVRYRKNIKIFTLCIFVILIIALNIIPILEFIGNYFPIISQRLIATIVENDQSGRAEIRDLAMQKIIDNPILGYSYRLFPSESGYGPHNGILEIFLYTGIPTGILLSSFFYIKSIFLTMRLIDAKKYFFPVCLLIFTLISSISGSLINSIIFWVAVALVCSSYYNKNNVNIKQ